MKNTENTDTSRRSFLKKSAALLGTYPLTAGIVAASAQQTPGAPAGEGVRLVWLTRPVKSFAGATCGVAWPKGKVKKKTTFQARDEHGNPIIVQSWPLAFWPDGSLKWTGHAIVATAISGNAIYLTPVKAAPTVSGLTVSEQAQQIIVDTGVMRCVIEKNGPVLVRSLSRADNTVAKDGRLVLIVQDQPDGEETTHLTMRAVIKVSGIHRAQHNGDALIPFTVRLYFYDRSEAIRVIHTLVYDGDANKHFIKGVGLTFDVPMQDQLYNRHIRFSNSEHNGIFAEAVQGLTGLRRDPGEAVRDLQRAGEAVPPESEFGPGVVSRLKYIPAFGDYTLYQGSDGAFTIRKRTATGYGWLTSATGHRAAGLMYLGTPKGGLAIGIRNFWQSYPAQLDIRHAAADMASVTAWLWAPSASAMDMRFYHDGMDQDTFPKQREGLEITYEDYEPGFGSAQGVARTSELMLWGVDKTPESNVLVEMTNSLQDPPLLICDLPYLAAEKVFGGNWSIVDRSIPAKARIEDQLDRYFDYYKKQIDVHHWYGFWNYGDFMHTYDRDRHTWRYDVGGFAWDNSELSTDLWLWYYFLHTGRADVFRVAEAMTRHTGEVDVHHLGPFAPLGSRHNVLHWGCSAKQLRISTAANRRIYYYLTGDERVGDLLDEQVDAAARLKDVVPGRKLPDGGVPTTKPAEGQVTVGFGTDWGAIAAAWLTRWERTEDAAIRQKLLNSMQTIAHQPKGFFTGSGWLDLSSGKFTISKNTDISVSHLSAVFGLTEICEELIAVVDIPEFTKAWLQYCRLYKAAPEEQQLELGHHTEKMNLEQGHSRLTAYAASYLRDENLAKRAWAEFYGGKAGITPGKADIRTVTGPEVLAPLEEDLTISTNAVAQWGLAALQCLVYIGNHIQKT
jgi:hypothetical protein